MSQEAYVPMILTLKNAKLLAGIFGINLGSLDLTNSPVKYLVVHCSASAPKTFVDAAVITRWHIARGFLKIGYHYVILRDGTVQKGRKDSEVGAHVEGHNTGSLGICLVGGLSDTTGKPENNFTVKQFDSLANLLQKLSTDNPKAEVLGHRDFPNVAKACPCFEVKQWWNAYL